MIYKCDYKASHYHIINIEIWLCWIRFLMTSIFLFTTFLCVSIPAEIMNDVYCFIWISMLIFLFNWNKNILSFLLSHVLLFVFCCGTDTIVYVTSFVVWNWVVIALTLMCLCQTPSLLPHTYFKLIPPKRYCISYMTSNTRGFIITFVNHLVGLT